MPLSPARVLARDVLSAVETGGYASDLLHSSQARGLALADRRLATEIVMGVLRWRAQLDRVIELAAGRPVARIEAQALLALRIGVYQLRYLSRIPAMAAVHESVEMAKGMQPRLAGFVNAVLRHVSREPISALLASENDLGRRRAIEFSHPAWLLERWSRNFGPSAADAIAEFDNDVPPVAIRVRGGGDLSAAARESVLLEPGRLLTAALRVTGGDITKTEEFRQGRILVQDEASQLIPYLLEPQTGDRILDTCAAPGGKTELLSELAPGALLIAIEPHPQRARRLQRRLLGAERVFVVAADASHPLPLHVARAGSRGFDRILVDAPCTGTGTLARNPEIRWRLQPSEPARLAQLQRDILTQASAMLRPGGRLVYSVCSIEPEEGPGVVAGLLAHEPDLGVVPAERVLADLAAAGQLAPNAPTLTAGPYLRILPGAAATDGFFAAILERRR